MLADPTSNLVYVGEAPPALRARARAAPAVNPKTPRSWAVTIAPDPTMLVRYISEVRRGRRKITYDHLLPREQRDFINRTFEENILSDLFYEYEVRKFSRCEFTYEFTKAGRVHCHGIVTWIAPDPAIYALKSLCEKHLGRTLIERLDEGHTWCEYMYKHVVESQLEPDMWTPLKCKAILKHYCRSSVEERDQAQRARYNPIMPKPAVQSTQEDLEYIIPRSISGKFSVDLSI